MLIFGVLWVIIWFESLCFYEGLNLSLSYIILLSLFYIKIFSFGEVSLVLDGRGLYGYVIFFEIFCFVLNVV